MPSTRPPLRITCCLCLKRVPARQDVYPLDDEWARRYPGMRGRLACPGCALRDNYWDCQTTRDNYVPGHILAAIGGRDIDSWSHVGPPHTQVAAVLAHPASAMLQGGEDYLRWVAAARPGTAPEVRARLGAFLAEWPAEHPPAEAEASPSSAGTITRLQAACLPGCGPPGRGLRPSAAMLLPAMLLYCE